MGNREGYSRRIQAFRASMIKELPRAPNNKASRASLEAMPTRRLILTFITWRMRVRVQERDHLTWQAVPAHIGPFPTVLLQAATSGQSHFDKSRTARSAWVLARFPNCPK